MGILEDILLSLQSVNQSIKDLHMAITTQVINVSIVVPNAPPQYTGPTTLSDLVVGQTVALQGFDPDGDPITWSVEPNALVTVSPAGVLTPVAAGSGAVTVTLDDGK